MDFPPFLTVLREMFPRTQEQILNDVIQMVEENSPNDVFEQKIENMINLLSGDGAQGPMPILNNHNINNNLHTNLLEIFPEVDEDYLYNYVNSVPNGYDIEDAIEDLGGRNLPTKKIDPIVIQERLQAALPNANPNYLQKEAHRLARLTSEDLDNFVQNAIEKNDYPSMQDYLKTKRHTDELAVYKEKFNVKKFLQMLPNPEEKFSNPLQLPFDNNANEDDEKFALSFLYNQFRFVRRKYIELLFKWEKKNLVRVYDRLEKLRRSLRKARPMETDCGDCENICLLQLITYLKHRKLIKREIKFKNEEYLKAKEEARKYNLLETCLCCFDEELIPEECFCCARGCVFCKDCVKKGVEVGIGKGDVKFPCLSDCTSEFTLHTLQMVLPTNTFRHLAQRIASEEIKKANIDGLETCPFCDFAMVMPENEKIFKCINEDCLAESCRQCRQVSHIPLRCNEVEYDEDVRRRTFIENKMTEALTRTCYNCKKLFIKSTGCNKMTCTCGAKMCYLCGQAINNYFHFGNGQDGRCLLVSNDAEVHLQRVITGAKEAKKELGNVEIKFDPAANIQQFFIVPVRKNV